MNLWSGDQSVATSSIGPAVNWLGSSLPLIGLEKTSRLPLRLDEYRISSPDAFHAPSASTAGSNVRRLLIPRSRSKIQMSGSPSVASTASLWPSGDSIGPL